jgi:hypothetical protein
MSKRFGRNQRRRLREEVARLTLTKDSAIAAMAIMDIGPWLPATPKIARLEDLCLYFKEIEVTESMTYRGIRRKARVSLIIDDATFRRLNDAHYSSVAWRGIQWRMDAVDYDHYRGLREENEIEIDLDAIGAGNRLWPDLTPEQVAALKGERSDWDADAWRRLYQAQPLPSYRPRSIGSGGYDRLSGGRASSFAF